MSLFDSAFCLLLDVVPSGWLGIFMLPILVIAVVIVAAVLLIYAIKKKRGAPSGRENGTRKAEGEDK